MFHSASGDLHGANAYPGAMQVAIQPPPPQKLQANYADMQTTVYVGHICNRIPDESVRELLDICGQVTRWNRQPDPVTGRWAHFGFCEFKKLEGAWRAVELLNGRQLGSRKMIVKADSKVQGRITEYPMTQRVSFEHEQRLRANIDALLTNINSNWREAAIARDAELQEPDSSRPRYTEPVNAVVESDALPHWYRDSRKEADRLRRIDRRKRDRQAAFERAMRDWEHDEKRIMREFTEDRQSNDESIERKRALIEQDRGEQRVVSGFTPAEREREIEADDRDRQQELKEIEQKRLKDEAELQQLSERLETLSSMSSAVIRSVQDQPKEIPKVDSKVLQVIRKIPISPEAVSRASIDWNRVINEQTLLKLRSWLRSKLERLGCSDDEAQVLSSFVVRSMDSGSHSLYAIAACMRRLKRLDEDTVSELSKKCVQLLLFSQFILQ